MCTPLLQLKYFTPILCLLLLVACSDNQDFLDADENAKLAEQRLAEQLDEVLSTPLDLAHAQPITLNPEYGIGQKAYLLEDDILIPEKEYLRLKAAADDKHYRAINLIENCRAITIAGKCGLSSIDPTVLNEDIHEAILWAVQQYNSLRRSVGINFRVLPCDQYDEADIKVFIDPDLRGVIDPERDILAMAGFPDQEGNPFPTISIGPRLTEIARPFNQYYRTAMVHEIGHTIGFRHTDWFSPTSCSTTNPPGPEEDPMGIGAVHIPGTPEDHTDYESIMRACAISTNVFNPYFSALDKVAIRHMYPKWPCEPVRPPIVIFDPDNPQVPNPRPTPTFEIPDDK